ncbi:MAG: MoaD/ThiS family protein [Nitritalea sp.]
MVIHFYGQLAELVGQETLTLSPDQAADTAALLSHLYATYPLLQAKTFKLAINETLVQDTQPLRNGDRVALLPPFSGG